MVFLVFSFLVDFACFFQPRTSFCFSEENGIGGFFCYKKRVETKKEREDLEGGEKIQEEKKRGEEKRNKEKKGEKTQGFLFS